MKKIRALVIEDSITVRKRLVEVLSSDPEIEVVGEAEDGKRGIELSQQLRPDVITVDMMLPIVTGLGVTEHVMAHMPTPILIVSSSTNRADLFKTYEALSAGALDVLEKPNGSDSNEVWERKFVAAVKLISRIKVITHPRAKLGGMGMGRGSAAAGVAPRSCTSKAYGVIAIGASTGGPGAIVELFQSLPPNFPIPILYVLHINEPFGMVFVDWIGGLIPHPVRYARDGEHLAATAGTILMAPPARHLSIQRGRVSLSCGPERNYCRPSVDVLFESIALEFGAKGIGCLLTGMGRDGASGLLEIRKAGGFTIAQDEATSVVYGMPREAALLNAAEQVLPLNRIAPVMAAMAGGRMEHKT